MTETEQAEAILVGKMEIKVGEVYELWEDSLNGTRSVKVYDIDKSHSSSPLYWTIYYHTGRHTWRGIRWKGINSDYVGGFGKRLRSQRILPRPKSVVVETPNLTQGVV